MSFKTSIRSTTGIRDLDYDDDGFLKLSFGTIEIFICLVSGDVPYVRILSPLLTKVQVISLYWKHSLPYGTGRAGTAADIDHYIPFSQYPRDLAHNFVLAHPSCNRSKSDTLAALPHLEKWLARIVQNADSLAEIGAEAGFVTDLQVTYQVGSWAYSNAAANGSHPILLRRFSRGNSRLP